MKQYAALGIDSVVKLNKQAESESGIASRPPSIFHSSLLWKLYAALSVLIILSFFGMGSMIARNIERNALQSIEKSLHANAFLLKEMAFTSLFENRRKDEQLQKRVLSTGRKIGTRLTVIAADGTVIADSEKDPAAMDNHVNRPEIVMAKTKGTGTITRFSRTTNSHRMYLASSVIDGTKLIGYVRTSLPLTVIDQRLSELRWIIFMSTTAAAVVALILGLLLSHHIVKPLIVMTCVVQKAARGEPAEKLSTLRSDELGDLAKAFNQLIAYSQSRMEMLTTDRNKLSVILSGMVEGVIAVDREERILHMNEAAGKLLQLTPQNTLERPISDVVQIRELSDILEDAITKETDFQRKIELKIASMKRHIEMRASALRDGNGNLVGAVVVLYDVTKLYQLEAIRRDFVANASHELKTPVTAIRMVIETLIDDETLSCEMQNEFLNRVRNQSLRLSSIINDLLTLSRIESKSDDIKHAPFDLRDCIRSAEALLSPLGKKKEVSMDFTLPGQSVEIIGNKQEMSEVVDNLIDNALKYSQPGGSIKVSLIQNGQKAILEVTDTGIGISPKDQQRIFERFYQVDKVRSRESGGTGLGLSIVKHIVQAHQGTIEVESSLGAGSTFRVTLPAA